MTLEMSFDGYLQNLGALSQHIDPTTPTAESERIRHAAMQLGALEIIDLESVSEWVSQNPSLVPVLGLAVGLSQERLKNVLKNRFGTSSWTKLAKAYPIELTLWLDEEYGLLDSVQNQRFRAYSFGDILVARAGTRATATRAGKAGRRVEDEIEGVAQALGLSYQTRTRFEGRNGRTAPCDLAVPAAPDASIVVAAKGFDSTGSKLTDAVREIEEMADVRRPNQFVMAVIDGIGWKSRQADLRKIYHLWETGSIDGMYTLATLDRFGEDLAEAARLRSLL